MYAFLELQRAKSNRTGGDLSCRPVSAATWQEGDHGVTIIRKYKLQLARQEVESAKRNSQRSSISLRGKPTADAIIPPLLH